MSYLSSSENVGGIPQNISETSCATQYKMAVEGVSGNCGDVNMFMHDGADDQTYIAHPNDSYFHTKFKIDPNELYTFHDSDVIAGEITVSHTEDHYVVNDEVEEVETVKNEQESPARDIEVCSLTTLANGDLKTHVQTGLATANGHYSLNSSAIPSHPVAKRKNKVNSALNHKTKAPKTQNTKALKTKGQGKELIGKKSVIEHQQSVHKSKNQSPNINIAVTSTSVKTSVNNVSTDSVPSNATTVAVPSLKTGSETFLDVFKRELGVIESPPTVNVKTESPVPPTPTTTKVSVATKKQSAGKTSQTKARRGRGPAVHEALQRIPPKRAIPLRNRPWHAPGEELFQCGPLDDKPPLPVGVESSSDDDQMPDIGLSVGAISVEEIAAETRAARLEQRRAALRRQVVRADAALKLSSDHRKHRTLASIIKKQLRGQGPVCRLPAQTVSHLLASRGLSSVLTSQERRRLRESGWSGGESGSNHTSAVCAEERCTKSPVPCGRYCLSHVTLDTEQRLYASCAAVFAGGTRCMQPLLPLQDQTPLCTEHAWKRDNYDKLIRDGKPKKAVAVRKRVWPPPQRPPRRPKRRRRPLVKRPHSQPQKALSEINVCSNSSTYDSSEDAAMGGFSETEYMVPPSHELEVEVGHVPPDDILDPAVLSQIPDEAFTEFFNQAEGGPPFAESSELTAVLEAVLDERALDSIADCVFTPQQLAKNKIQHVQASVSAQPSSPS